MKRFLPLFILLLLLAFALAACGGDTAEDPEEATAVPEEPVDEPEEEPAATPVPVEELACDDEIGCVEVAPGDPLLLASALVISGANAQLGIDSQRGVEIALAFRPELLGHPVELQAEDDGCNAEGGQAAGQKIVSNPQVAAIIGTSCSGAGVPMSQIISDAGYAMVSPSNTSPVLTDPDQAWRPGYLRTAHNDKIQGRAMAEFVYNELELTKAAVIHDGDPYTEGLATVFSNVFQELGGEVVAFEAEDANATNVEPLLTTVAAAGPEIVYFPTFTSLSALITKTAKEIDGLQDVVVLASADGALSQDFLDAAGSAAEGMYHSGPDLSFDNPVNDEFLAAYLETYGEEPPAVFHAHSFDAANMVLDAIEDVGQVGTDGTVLIGRQALRDALYATSGFDGITGTLTCDEYGDCADARIAVNQVQGGDFVPIWPVAAGEAAAEEPVAFECADEIGCVEVAPGDPILLASVLVISGPNAQLGIDSQRGVEIALAFRPEVAGHPVELQAEDDGCNAEGGQAAGQKIVSNPQVAGIVGTSCSGAGVPMSQIVSDAGYAMVSPSNTSPVLTDPDQAWRPGYLRTAHNDKIQGRAMAEFVYDELGLTKAAVIHDGDPYTEGLATVFSNVFQELGGEVVAFEAEDANATNVEPLLTTISAAGPEIVYFPTFTSLSALITKTAKEIDGLQDVVVLASADGALSQDFLDAAGSASEGMYHSGPDLSFENPVNDAFLAAYLETYGEEPPAVFHAHSFDAANILLDAIEAVALVDDTGALLIGRQALRDALYATSGYQGITGTLTCDEFGDCADARIAVNQVQDGDFVPIWP